MVTVHGPRHGNDAAISQAARLPNPAATINDVPDELLLEVVAYFRASDGELTDFSSLLALSKTDKRFHRLVSPELYANFKASDCEPYLFLRTLLSSPDLAKLVKHADIYQPGSVYTRYNRHVLDAQDKRVIREGLRLAGVRGWEQVATECNKEPVELRFICTVIALQTRNLVSHNMSHRFEQSTSESSFPAWMALSNHVSIGPSFDRVPKPEHLRSISITRGDLSIIKCSCLFHIPSLRKLRLDDLIVADEGNERGAETLRHLIPSQCNSIEYIRFEACFIQADMLEVLIASTRGLKEFWYRLSLERLDFELKQQDDLRDMKLNKMLDRHKGSLENLIFNNDSREHSQSHIAMDLHEGLQDFAALKDLDCPLSMLIRPLESSMTTLAAKLPPLLFGFGVSVSRHREELDLLESLEHLSSVYKEYTPHLEFVWIEVKATGPKFRYNWDRLETAFDETEDIQLNIEVEESYSDDDASQGSQNDSDSPSSHSSNNNNSDSE